MPKIYAISVILFLSFITFKSFAQFSIEPGDSINKVHTVTNPDFPDFFEEVIVKAELSNNSGVTDTIYWEVLSINAPADWQVSYCGGVCIYDITVGQSFEYILQPTIPPNRPEEMKAQFTPNWQPGEGDITVLYYAKSDPINTTDTLHYKLSASIDSTNMITAICDCPDDFNIGFYPNPADKYLYVHGLEAIQGGHIAIYNIIGKQLATYSTTKESVIPVTNLEDGIYLLKIFDKQYKQVYSDKFIKRD